MSRQGVPQRVIALAGCVAATLLILIASSATAAPNRALAPAPGHPGRQALRGAASGPVAQFNRQTYAYTSALTPAQEGARYSVLVLQYSSKDATLLPALRAGNPNLKIFVYQDSMFTSSTDRSGYTTCVPYPQMQPSWFLTDPQGTRITHARFLNDYFIDIGNPAVQQACANHAVAIAQKYGFDGVYLDDVSTWGGRAAKATVTIARYPTPAAWQSAVTSELQAVVPVLRAHNLLAIGNISGSEPYPGIWQQWNGLMDGAEEETYIDVGAGTAAAGAYWQSELAQVDWSEANGKIAILHTTSGSDPVNTFGLASMLLSAGGEASYSTSNTNYSSSENWFPEYSTALALGPPMGPYQAWPNGEYERVFAGGVVLVNPTGTAQGPDMISTDPTIVYSGSGYTNTQTVSLAPFSAAILTQS